jgi:hypothetical protein
MPNDNGKLSRVQGFFKNFCVLERIYLYLNDWVSWVGAGWLFSFSVAAKGLKPHTGGCFCRHAGLSHRRAPRTYTATKAAHRVS